MKCFQPKRSCQFHLDDEFSRSVHAHIAFGTQKELGSGDMSANYRNAPDSSVTVTSRIGIACCERIAACGVAQK
jgi:hypothetical protein